MDWEKHARRIVDRLGEDVTYTPSGGSAVTVRGVFSKYYVTVGMPGADASASNPVIGCMTADVPNARAGDAFTIRGVGYKVSIPEPDADGMTVLQLEAD